MLPASSTAEDVDDDPEPDPEKGRRKTNPAGAQSELDWVQPGAVEKDLHGPGCPARQVVRGAIECRGRARPASAIRCRNDHDASRAYEAKAFAKNGQRLRYVLDHLEQCHSVKVFAARRELVDRHARETAAAVSSVAEIDQPRGVIDAFGIYAAQTGVMDEPAIGAADVEQARDVCWQVVQRPAVVPAEPIDDRHSEIVVARVVPGSIPSLRRIPELKVARAALPEGVPVPSFYGVLKECAVADRTAQRCSHGRIVTVR